MEHLQTCKDFGCDCRECETVGTCLLFQGLPDIHIEFQHGKIVDSQYGKLIKEKGVNE